MTTEPPKTLGDLLFFLREQWGGRRDLVLGQGHAKTLSSRELISDVHALALSLEAFGARPGDRLALLADNRPEWLVCDLACHLLGIVSVPIDPRLPAEEIGYILRNSGSTWLVWGGHFERGLVDAILAGIKPAPRVIAMDPPFAEHELQLDRLIGQGTERFHEVSLDSLRSRTQPSDLATLAYTSGATGDPRGVRLSQRNLASALQALASRLTLTYESRALSLLPWAHPLERIAVYAYLQSGSTIVCPPHGIDPLVAVEREAPDIFVSPPGLLERSRERILASIALASPSRRALFERALRLAAPKNLSPPRSWSRLARIGLRPIREALGGRVPTVVCGFAPVPLESERFFRAAGFDLCIGYGLVETSGLITATSSNRQSMGTVGTVLPGGRLQAGKDGEILFSGPTVMQGYWQSEEPGSALVSSETEAVWFDTGDFGHIDRNGSLTVEARRSSLIQLESGESIAPHPIEQRLQISPLISRAVLVGQGQAFLGVLLVSPAADSLTASELEAALLAELQRLNEGQPERKKVRRFHLLPRPLSIASGELTRNGQLRRKAITERWGDSIEALFS